MSVSAFGAILGLFVLIAVVMWLDYRRICKRDDSERAERFALRGGQR